MYITYQEALAFASQDSEKIKVVVFGVQNCPTCDDFLPHVLAPALEARSEHFECVYVDASAPDVPFPPTSTPTVYFYIPNTAEPMPFFRVGGTLPSVLHKDLDAMVKIKDNGMSAADAFSSPMETITSWVHRLLR